jgi:hypothetical protein
VAVKHYYVPEPKITVIVQVHDDGGFKVSVPIEGSNSVKAAVAA